MAFRFFSSMDIKRQNLANTLHCILACEHISLLELTRKLSLSGTSVLQNVKILAELGLLAEAGSYSSTGGRKAKAYAPLKNARVAAGLDITRNHASVVLVNLAGEIERFQRQRLPFAMNDDYFAKLAAMVKAISAGVEDKTLGLGISLPGIINADASLVRYSHVLDLRDVPTALFSSRLPYACKFLNDANAAGLAEVYGANDSGMLVYLSLSSSVGGAILNNGLLYEGHNLRAGELGHMTIVPGGRQCYCGKKGCLDAYCSSMRLASHADGNLDGFFKNLANADAASQELWRECLEYLAIAVNNINMIMDCDVIVGGYLGAYLEEFGGDFRQMLGQRNTFSASTSYLRYCRFKKEAAAVGAALAHVNSFISSISLP